MKHTTGINGFGRFGLHLLKYWIDRNSHSNFEIAYINDDTLTMRQAYNIMTKDEYVIFNKYKILMSESVFTILEPNGATHAIFYSTAPVNYIPWIGEPEVIFECSGKKTVAKDCEFYLTDKTKHVLISATSWDAEKTLVFGFNHNEFKKTDKIISYGSCTVNAFVPFANFMHKQWGVLDSDVNVVHNIVSYKLKDSNTLNRKFCTLEKSGPNMLPFLSATNFHVNYTVVPYAGVSIIDFRFCLESPVDLANIIKALEKSFAEGELKDLYTFSEADIGPEVNNCTTYSTVFIKESVKVRGNNIYFQGYFDSENSVNRYYDLATHILK